jgi:hypothetical protein
VEFEGDLLIQHGLTHESRNLVFAKCERAVHLWLSGSDARLPACRTNSPGIRRELLAATVAGLDDVDCGKSPKDLQWSLPRVHLSA